jgi:alkylation response protein AidB-like acyl-CoA dehydrogenase
MPGVRISSELAELLKLVDDLADLLRQEAPVGETAGNVTPVAANALEERGFLGLLAPRELGGRDLGPFDMLRVVEALALIDASAAWLVMVLNAQLRGTQLLDYETVRRVLYADGIPRIAGQGAPTGKAEVEDGGYRVTGKWSYGSGILHANFVSSGAVVTQGGEPVLTASGAAKTIMITTPVENVELLGNWDVLGLRATASLDYRMTDIFVPEDMTRDIRPGLRMSWGGPSTLVALPAWLLSLHTPIDLGLGRAVLDLLKAYARIPGRGGMRLADRGEFRGRFARAEAGYLSARSWVYEVWQDIEDCVASGEDVSRRQMTLARTALLNLHETNVANALMAFHEGGGVALRAGPLQRVLRDTLAAGQHVFVSPNTYDDCGRDFLDDAEGMTWEMFQLV